MKLTRIRRYGKARYINPETKRAVNVHTGDKVGGGCAVLFYYRSGQKILITDRDFYENWRPE